MSRAGEDDTTAVDRSLVAAQIGREPRALQAVAVRCVYGIPAVTRQAPVDDAGNPFPTAYYLTCPFLVKQVDRLEAAGGVKRFEARLEAEPELRDATLAAQQRHAAIDGRGKAIAGSGDALRVKCLHAHAAFQLAEGDHPLGAQVLREAAPRWCADAQCRGLLHTLAPSYTVRNDDPEARAVTHLGSGAIEDSAPPGAAPAAG